MGHCEQCGGNHHQLYNSVSDSGIAVKYCFTCSTLISNQISEVMDQSEYEDLDTL